MEHTAKTGKIALYGRGFFASMFLFLFLTGCDPSLSSPGQVSKFEKAGPIEGSIGFNGFSKGKPGPYRVIPGDVLEFQMHVNLRVVSSELADWHKPTHGNREIEPYLVRVSDAGIITLPIIGEIEVKGKTLAEIEEGLGTQFDEKVARVFLDSDVHHLWDILQAGSGFVGVYERSSFSEYGTAAVGTLIQ